MKRRNKQQPGNQPPKQRGRASFLQWCRTVKLKHPKCTIGSTQAGIRGVIALTDIKQGEVVIEVPDDAVLMVENCCIAEELEEAGLSKGAAGGDALLEVQGLVLAVMAEKAAGANSSWAAYLQDFMPQDMTHMPLYWTEAELEELRGTAALDKMEGQVQTPADVPTQVQLLWEEVAEPFLQEHPHLKLPKGTKGWALYQWATAAVASYSFVLGDDHYQAMVPFWDALNHITGKVNVRLHHQQGKQGSDDGCLQMIATRDIAAGEELVNNYGELSQAELLRAYGYVEAHDEANLYSNVQVPLKFTLQAIAAHRQSSNENDVSSIGSDSEGGSEWDVSSEEGEGEESGEGDEVDSGRMSGGQGVMKGSNAGGAPTKGRAGRLQQPAPAQKAGADVTASGKAAKRGTPNGKAVKAGVSQQGACDAGKVGKGGEVVQAPKDDIQSKAQQGAVLQSVTRTQCRNAVRGLPGRLRFLRRVGLLPSANVFKVYMPESTSYKKGLCQLLECIRLLLLPWPEFCALRERVLQWRPGHEQHIQLGEKGEAAGQHKRSGQAAAHTAVVQQEQHGKLVTTPLIDVGPITDTSVAQIQQVLCCVAQHMLSRYPSTLEEEERRLQQVLAHYQNLQEGNGHQQQDTKPGEDGKPAEGKAGKGSKRKAEGQPAEGGRQRKQGSNNGMLLPKDDPQPLDWGSKLASAVVARTAEMQCLHQLLITCGRSSVGDGSNCVWASEVQTAAADVWRQPRPGMYGVAAIGEDSSDDESGKEDSGDDDDGDDIDGHTKDRRDSGEAAMQAAHADLPHTRKAAASKYSSQAFAFGFQV